MEEDYDVDELLLGYIDNLGIIDESNVFHAGKHCIAGLKGIEILLKRDAPDTQSAHRKLGQWRTLQTRFVPMMMAYRDDKDIFFLLAKLIVRLTFPLSATVQFRSNRIKQMQEFKETMIEGDALAVCMTWLEEPLRADPRQEQDLHELELLLTMFKHLLMIPNPACEATVSDSQLHLQDNLLLKMQEEAILDTFVILAHHIRCEVDKTTLNVLLLEIFYHIFKTETPAVLLDLHGSRAKNQHNNITTHVAEIKMSKENGGLNGHNGHKKAHIHGNDLVKKAINDRLLQAAAKKKELLRTVVSSRHPRFGTNLALRRPELQNNRTHFIRNVFADHTYLPNDLFVRRPMKPPVPEPPDRVYLNSEVREILTVLAQRFIEFGYSELMSSVKEDCIKDVTGTVLLAADFTNFLYLSAFFMEFHRLSSRKKFKLHNQHSNKSNSDKDKKDPKVPDIDEYYDPTPLLCSLDTSAFKLLTDKLEQYMNHKPARWAELDSCVYVYKEYVRALYEMSNHGNELSRIEGHKLRSVAFYEQERIDLVFNLVKIYEPYRNSNLYLTRLVETVHFVMRTLSQLGKSNHFVLRKKRKTGRRKKKKDADAEGGAGKGSKPAPLRAPQVERIDNNDDDNDGSKSQEGVEGEEKGQEGENSNEGKVNGDGDAEIGEKQVEGDDNNDKNEKKDDNANNDGTVGTAKEDEEDEGEWEYESDEYDDEYNEAEDQYQRQEAQLEFSKIVLRYAHNQVIKNYCLLLMRYKTNSDEVNECIVRLFERLAIDRELTPMFFQLSLFVLFNQILSDASIRDAPAFKRLRNFCKHIVHQFFKLANDQPMLFVDILFWKNCMQSDQILNPDLEFDRREESIKKAEDDQRRAKAMKNAKKGKNSDDDSSDGEADIIANQGGGDFGQRRVVAVWDQSDYDYTTLNRSIWKYDEDTVLRTNYDIYADLDNCLEILSTLLLHRSPKQIEIRLKKMGVLDRHFADIEDLNNDKKAKVQLNQRITDLIQMTMREFCRGGILHVVQWLIDKLDYCIQYRQECIAGLKNLNIDDDIKDYTDEKADEDVATDFAIVPLVQSAFDSLNKRGTERLMRVLRFRPPSIENGEPFWRIPGSYTCDELMEMRDILADAVMQAPAQVATMKEQDLVRQAERIAKKAQQKLAREIRKKALEERALAIERGEEVDDIQKIINPQREDENGNAIAKDSDSEGELEMAPADDSFRSTDVVQAERLVKEQLELQRQREIALKRSQRVKRVKRVAREGEEDEYNSDSEADAMNPKNIVTNKRKRNEISHVDDGSGSEEDDDDNDDTIKSPKLSHNDEDGMDITDSSTLKLARETVPHPLSFDPVSRATSQGLNNSPGKKVKKHKKRKGKLTKLRKIGGGSEDDGDRDDDDDDVDGDMNNDSMEATELYTPNTALYTPNLSSDTQTQAGTENTTQEYTPFQHGESRTQNSLEMQNTLEFSNSNDNATNDSNETVNASQKKSRRRVVISDDDEDDDNDDDDDDGVEVNLTVGDKMEKKRIIDDDEDDDNDGGGDVGDDDDNEISKKGASYLIDQAKKRAEAQAMMDTTVEMEEDDVRDEETSFDPFETQIL